MKRSVVAMFAALALVSACGDDATKTPATPPANAAAKPTESPKPESTKPAESTVPAEGTAPAEGAKPTEQPDMYAAIAVLMAKPEEPDEKVEIQHILIAFQGAPRMTKVTRAKYEAKALAEEIYAKVIAGGDFDALVKEHTDDSFPGKYTVTKAGRTGFVKGFGDVGFRLKVGEIGVAPWSTDASPFGWHIIKRLK